MNTYYPSGKCRKDKERLDETYLICTEVIHEATLQVSFVPGDVQSRTAAGIRPYVEYLYCTSGQIHKYFGLGKRLATELIINNCSYH